MNRYIIYYLNGRLESVDSINPTFLHLLEIGVVRLMIDTQEGTHYVLGQDGIGKEVKVPSVKGL